MNRLGLIPPQSLEVQQEPVYETYEQIHRQYSDRFQKRDEQGCLLGPAGALIHTPEVAKNCQNLQSAVAASAQKSGLPRYLEDLVSLVVGARTHAAYEIYASSRNSRFPRAYLDDIRNGFCPSELDERGRVVFEVATELGKPGPLPEATWQAAVGTLGVDGATSLIQCVAFHTFMSTIANGFDVQLPASDLSQSSSTRSSFSE